MTDNRVEHDIAESRTCKEKNTDDNSLSNMSAQGMTVNDCAGNGYEEKRKWLWHTVFAVSTCVLVVVVIYFTYHILFSNPVIGTWTGKEIPVVMEIGKNDDVTLRYTQEDGETRTLRGKVEIDRDNKEITFFFRANDLEEARDTGDKQWRKTLSLLAQSYHYSIEKKGLYLIDREYGETYFFKRR